MKTFEDLSWDAVTKWAGQKIVARGQSYKPYVRDLARTDAGDLLAWVDGTRRYATHVSISAKGKPDCDCSCPYDRGPCKHAVAVILVYLDMVKAKELIPLAVAEDSRLKKSRMEADDDDDDDDVDYDDEHDDDHDEDDASNVAAS